MMFLSAIKRKREELRVHVKNNPNFGIQCFLFVMLTGYTLFFTSKVWLSQNENLIAATPYYQKVNLGEYAFYLTQFVYSEKNDAIQIILEIENKDVMEKELVYTAVERTSGNLKVRTVQEGSNYAVLRIIDIDKSWKEISFRVQEAGADSQAKFYTNINAVNRVAFLPEQSEEEYLLERLNGQIAFDAAQIKEKERQIQVMQEHIRSIEERIKALEEDIYPTEVEAQKAGELIVKAQIQKKSIEDTIQDYMEEIRQLQERTNNIKGQIKELKE